MKGNVRGIVCVLTSAFIFGFTPILGRLSYNGGSNAIMLTFLRAAMALPVLALVLKVKGISLRIDGRTLKKLVILGVCGSATTTVTLYASYTFIPVGMATVLHFAYPAIVILISIVFLGERVKPVKLVVLAMSTLGVALFCETGSSQILGILLALLSAVTYAFVMIFQYRSGLVELHPFKMSFYLCCVTSTILLPVGFFTGNLTFALTPAAYGYSFVVSMCVSVGGLSLLQYGLKHVGSTTASILSMLEPITSVLMGILVLGEGVGVRKLLGCLLILSGVCILTLSARREQREAELYQL